jgi:hypothetical protein
VVRATALGAISGFTLGYATPAPPPPPPVSAEVSPLPAGIFPEPFAYAGYSQPAPEPVQAIIPVRVAIPYYVPRYMPVYVSVPVTAAAQTAAIPSRPAWHLPESSSSLLEVFPSLPKLEHLASAAAGSGFPERAAVSTPAILAATPINPKTKRWQLSSWALLRGAAMPGSLASGGELGGSQAGARLLYSFTRSLAASLRMTSPIGAQRGFEVAGGVRWIPLSSVPIAITAERRQSVSRLGGGRSDFALFLEGGLYRRPLPLDLRLDGYFQAGIVGVSRRDLFADGAMAVSHPIFGPISAGFGAWGGAQPGLYRVDAGPRVSLHVRGNIYAHFDWRQRLTGRAQPNSGPAVTLSADF